MLIEQIRADMMEARKGSDAVAKSLLVTLYSEAQRVGKDKRNGATTDEEVIGVIRKFAANAEETQRLLQARGQNTINQTRELELLITYLPTQMTQEGLESAVRMIVSDLGLSGAKAMGAVMAELKARHAGTYDGKLASQVVKSILV
jgi:uncharacterized protein YqeY